MWALLLKPTEHIEHILLPNSHHNQAFAEQTDGFIPRYSILHRGQNGISRSEKTVKTIIQPEKEGKGNSIIRSLSKFFDAWSNHINVACLYKILRVLLRELPDWTIQLNPLLNAMASAPLHAYFQLPRLYSYCIEKTLSNNMCALSFSCCLHYCTNSNLKAPLSSQHCFFLVTSRWNCARIMGRH